MLQATQAARWQGLDSQVKQHIKGALLATLPSDVSSEASRTLPDKSPRIRITVDYSVGSYLSSRGAQQTRRRLLATAQVAPARHTAALVVAKVAAIELPLQQWDDLIGTLLGNMTATPPNSGLQQATLQTLGYVCEEMGLLPEDVLAQDHINSILTAVVQVLFALHHSLADRLVASACSMLSVTKVDASNSALLG